MSGDESTRKVREVRKPRSQAMYRKYLVPSLGARVRGGKGEEGEEGEVSGEKDEEGEGRG